LRNLPDALIVADVANQDTAISEAHKVKIPVVGIVDANADPRKVSYAIPANDESLPSVRFILERLVEAWEEGRQGASEKAESNPSELAGI